jgi:hypothetical protein
VILAGVDIGVRLVTICFLHESGDVFWERLEAPARFDALKAARIIHVLASRVDWPEVVWLERPYGRHVRSVSDLSRVVGALVSAIPVRVAIDEIAPNERKRLIGLPGNASKAHDHGMDARPCRARPQPA